MEIIAHRGASFDAPENTLTAIQQAWIQGADGVEIDVHQTADRKIVVCHDANTKRTTGVNAAIARRTWRELKRLEAGSWKGAQWFGETIPDLASVLASLPASKTLWIEVKCGRAALGSLLPLLARSPRKNQVILIGFSRGTLAAAKRKLPGVPMYWNLELNRSRTRPQALTVWNQILDQTRAAGLQGVHVSVRPLIGGEFVQRAHAQGLKVFVWTVDQVGTARRLKAMGVSGVTTNRPGWLRQQLERP
jgi:glycerophosphoryl diester phosphodiesterase